MSNYEPILAGARAIMVPGFVYELRALRVPGAGVISGYFDDAEKLARVAVELDGQGQVYITLNPVLPELLKRAPNCVRRNVAAGETTSDDQILFRARLLVDFDPERPTGVSSTDSEKASALHAAEANTTRLLADGADTPTLCDSGNGYHHLYWLWLPNNAYATDRVNRLLQTIKRESLAQGVNVDTTVGNAARITRLYGTMNCKGENTPERPWRRSGVIQ
jgi:hypothetical protein